MPRLNCWEYHDCGRAPGGRLVSEMGVCPTPLAVDADGIHGGRNGGRVCWVIAGTLCDGNISGSRAAKLESCLKCGFCQLVFAEESIDGRIEDHVLRPPE